MGNTNKSINKDNVDVKCVKCKKNIDVYKIFNYCNICDNAISYKVYLDFYYKLSHKENCIKGICCDDCDKCGCIKQFKLSIPFCNNHQPNTYITRMNINDSQPSAPDYSPIFEPQKLYMDNLKENCLICLTNKRSTMNYPCMCITTCSDCNNNKCEICYKTIEKYLLC